MSSKSGCFNLLFTRTEKRKIILVLTYDIVSASSCVELSCLCLCLMHSTFKTLPFLHLFIDMFAYSCISCICSISALTKMNKLGYNIFLHFLPSIYIFWKTLQNLYTFCFCYKLVQSSTWAFGAIAEGHFILLSAGLQAQRRAQYYLLGASLAAGCLSWPGHRA